ncbi:MAG: ATP-dependent helicase [Acidimicrobiales bacterium]
MDALLADLTPAQRRAVTTSAPAVCILAAAGSGKTRVLTRRIAYRILTDTADPAHVLALTFTRRAAGELDDRLRTLGVRHRLTAGTFHAVAYTQLRRYWADRGQRPAHLLDRKAGLLARLVGGRGEVAAVPLPELAAEIEWASARLISPDRYPAAADAARRRLPVAPEAIGALMARYHSEKIRRGVIDFDDLLARCADALAQDPAFAAAQRWRWRHVFVDEFQDLNPLQYRLLMGWLGSPKDVCVVGDPNQAVYGWNGADCSLLTTLPDRWPGLEIVRLDDNHRCSPQVVAAAGRVLGEPALRSSRPDGVATAVRSFPDEVAEARGVAAEARQRRASGLGWTQMAILVRTNAQIPAFESACRAAQIPYRVAGARGLLDDPDVQTVLADLRRRRTEPFAMVAADLARAPDPPDTTNAYGAASPAHPGARPAGAPTRASETQPSDALDPAAAARQRETSSPAAAARQTLSDLAGDYQRLETGPTVDGFLSWLAPATSRDRVDSGGSGITISTFHRAKGLEWHAVWVAGLEEGLVPIAHADSPETVAEERRLLYVAMTRASDELRCSWATHRSFGERALPRNPSPWLRAVADVGPARISDWRQAISDQRQQLARARRPGPRRLEDEADPGVIDALRTWRANTARAAGVPAHVVLHDATLAALAFRRPTCDEELLTVPGLGALKVSRYGAALLDVLRSTEDPDLRRRLGRS